MRQRKVKNEEEKIAQYADWILEEPQGWKGRWEQAYAGKRPAVKPLDANSRAAINIPETDNRLAAEPFEAGIYLEIGCGKGNFITTMARRFPQRQFLAVEGAKTVVLRALEKAAGGEPLGNIRFITAYVQTLSDLFEPGEVRGIYLNFSDPWPKERHAKRRLTHRRYLEEYRKIITPGGFLEFKTDNDALFDFSLREFQDFGLRISEATDDLHKLGNLCGRPRPAEQYGLPGPGEGAGLSAGVVTEYEGRFSAMRKNIHYCRVEF